MNHQTLIQQANSMKEFFDRSTRCLEEKHASFKPTDDSMTVAQQVAHVGQTIDWFIDGVFDPKGFDTDFDKHLRSFQGIESLAAARAWADKAFARLASEVKAHSMEDWMSPIPKDSIMGGAPRIAIFSAIDDHTAHHRGALTVYSRLLGLVPAMPYMETGASVS